ncbi:MAG TPA: hypothetical protein VF339_18550 [Gammaproteobacteria bacterium]
MKHLPQAGLCQACIDKLAASIAADPKQRINLTWCPHIAGGTIAKVNIENGVVVGWELKAPIREDEVRSIFERMAEIADPSQAFPWQHLQ